jgi:hypothetical protein
MQITVQGLRANFSARRPVRAMVALGLMLMLGCVESGLAQTGTPLNIFKNYFVTGDYVVAGWVPPASPDGSGYAKGTISIPDTRQINALAGSAVGPTSVPKGADIVAAYLYWATVEASTNAFAGQKARFNGYDITGTVLGNPNAPTSWSSGGCSGSSQGSKTMRAYRADVRPYLPLDLDPGSPTFGALLANGTVPVSLADSGSNGNTTPFALGASLVVIYRVTTPETPLKPAGPLNAIVLYDGSFAPSNTSSSMSQTIVGFYEPGIVSSLGTPAAKITHIVANGQLNKNESVSFGSHPLPSLYPNSPPVPGVYGSWDNPTWSVGNFVNGSVPGFDTQETTSVVPSSSNSGCVSWGAIVLSTTVQDTDGDGLLDVWEQGDNPGYTDAVSGLPVALPGANPSRQDLFVEVDYLTLRDSAGKVLHSHLPKKAALDAVGDAFNAHEINVHFDLGSNVYQGDPYVVQTGAGGNEIPESSLLCSDTSTKKCAFPGQPAVSWKGDFETVQNDPSLGNFQPGRAQSYHYALFGHSLGEPRFYWGTAGSAFVAKDPQDFASSLPQLVSIVDAGNTATVTIKSPAGVVKPGDCLLAPVPAACSDPNSGRVTIAGALIAPLIPGTGPQPASPLNGTYIFSNATSGSPDGNGVTTTTFKIPTVGVPDGPYAFNNEPQLGVSYLGPTSSSGHSDFSGGGDFAVTLGLWRADDVAGCQLDPSITASVYCDDQVGTLNVQIGTLMHELGHTLTLTHGGTFFNSNDFPNVPSYELNCKPNFLSVMNYLFQIRGFVDGVFDYSAQQLTPLNEASLDENFGIGMADHPTRWYSRPNATDLQLHNQAKAHCDGSPLGPNEVAGVRVDGSLAANGAVDWNNNLVIDPVTPPIDVNFNGGTADSPFRGFDDWSAVDLRQMSARASGFGFSEGGGLKAGGGGGLKAGGGGGVDNEGGGLKAGGGGGLKAGGGGGLKAGGGGGIEQDTETANSTVGSPAGLTCTKSLNNVPGCVAGSGSFVENAKSVPLTWLAPNFGQIRKYDVWKAEGSFPTLQLVVANFSKFSRITTVTGAPPSPSFLDPNVKNNRTYTYFVTDGNIQGAQSGPSAPIVVTVK